VKCWKRRNANEGSEGRRKEVREWKEESEVKDWKK
jgi:hypothetical protein